MSLVFDSFQTAPTAMPLISDSFQLASTAMPLSNDSPTTARLSESFSIVLPSDQTTLGHPSTITDPPVTPPSQSSNASQHTPALGTNMTVAIAVAVPTIVITIVILVCLDLCRRRRAKTRRATEATETGPQESNGNTNEPTTPTELSTQSRPQSELPGTTLVGTPSPVGETSGASQRFQHLPEYPAPVASLTPPIAPEDDIEIQSLQRQRVMVRERRERMLMLDALDEEDRQLQQRISERMTGLRGAG